MKRLFLVIFAAMASVAIHAVSISGVVKDAQTNEEIIGATIRIKDNPSIGTTSNIDGSFQLKVDKLPTILICTYVGYKSAEVTVSDESVLNIRLSTDANELTEVVISGEAKKTGEAGMVQATKNADVMQNGVSSQQIQKTQDKDASEVMKRVAGVSLNDNRFVMVRGLAQRYNNVWLNGSAAPSSEADSRAFSFDIIPSSQIDNMVVVKSPSPEYPADFGGGMILLDTKDIPNENSVNIGVNVGGNTQTTFSDYSYSKSSWSDVLGFDGGLRGIRGGINGKLNFIEGNNEAVNLLGNGLNNDWTIHNMKALPDMSLSANVNHRFMLNEEGTLLGLVGMVNWANSYKTFLDMTNNLFGVYDVANDRSNYLRNSVDNQYNQHSKVCSMLNMAYRSADDNLKIEWKNMLNILGHARLITRDGISAQSNSEQSAEYFYSSRITFNTQLDGTHKFWNSVLQWRTGYAYSNRNMPDRRRYVIDDALTMGVMQLTTGNEINREWTYLNENTFSASADWKKKLTIGKFEPVVKVGVLGEKRHREYTTRNFIYNWNQYSNTLSEGFRQLEIPQLMNEENYGLDRLHLLEEVKMRNNYKGNNTVGAAYLSATVPVGSLELHGGLRFEHNLTELINNTRDYEVSETSAKYTYNNIFPSVNIKYEFNEQHQMRVAYGRSCNRPEFRELSSSVFYDFDLASDVQGNTELKTCFIDNVETRYEFYPSNGEQIVIGAFLKNFNNPIEWTYTVAGGTDLVYSYENAKSALNYGVELDARLKLDRFGLPNITWTFNGALIHSRVKFNLDSPHRNRPMQGQSPYLINTGIYWNSESAGLQVAVLYNRIGKRIVGVGRSVGSVGGEDTANVPDSYEMPRNVIDLSVSKNLGKSVNLKLSVRDLLAEKVLYNQIDNITYPKGLSKTIKETTKSYRPGISIQLGASIKL